MKELKRFLRRHKAKIMLCMTFLLLVAVVGASLIYAFSEKMSPSIIFYMAAVLMVDLAVNYSVQKKKNKGVYAFYALTAAACIAIGCILKFMPTAE